MAVVGLILGIIGVLCSTLFPLFFLDYADFSLYAAPACVGVGLPLSWVAARRARENAASSSAIPAAGLAINIVALAFIIIWVIFIVIAGFATDWKFDWVV
jgi:hypothetical protein